MENQIKKNDWIEIKNYYLHNSVSLLEISKKYKISLTTVKYHCRKEKWREQKKLKNAEIDKQLSDALIKKEVDRRIAANEKHNELYGKCLEVAELLLNGYLEALRTGKHIKKANAYNLDFITKSIANAQKGQRQALNIEDKVGAEDLEPEVHLINGIDLEQI